EIALSRFQHPADKSFFLYFRHSKQAFLVFSGTYFDQAAKSKRSDVHSSIILAVTFCISIPTFFTNASCSVISRVSSVSCAGGSRFSGILSSYSFRENEPSSSFFTVSASR